MAKLGIYVALDRSGSMGGEKWTNAIESLNTYVENLSNEKVKGEVSIYAFDSTSFSATPNTISQPQLTYWNQPKQLRIVPLAENTKIGKFSKIDPKTLYPSGGTPLYDAAAKVMDDALASKHEKVVVVIITDGEENTSTEYTQQSIKEKVKLITDKGNEVIFLGANFDASRYVTNSGLDLNKYRAVDMTNKASYTETFNSLYSSTLSFASTGAKIDMTEVKDTDSGN